ncbi:hypothetical protein [Vibrio chagasii]|uniref:hypothetical protein n=1 Tax=Vibrio chagasii TaxID=170679 RepID=UPI00373576D8
MSAGSAGVGIAKSEILTYKTKVETWNLRFKIASFFIVIFLACSFLIVGLCSSTSAIKHIQQIQTSQMDVIKAKVADSNNVKVASTGTNVPLIPKANAAESVDNVADTSEVKNKTDVKAENNEKNTTEIKQSEKSSTQPKTSDKSEEPKTSQKVKEKKLNSDDTFSLTMVSTGSIITLIAFILGVGLTMILTLFKFTFSPPEDASNSKDPAVTLAGPLSELIRSISDYLVKKFKLN